MRADLIRVHVTSEEMRRLEQQAREEGVSVPNLVRRRLGVSEAAMGRPRRAEASEGDGR